MSAFFSNLSLGSAILLIFAVCAGYVFVRGAWRMLIGTAILVIAAWAAWSTWRAAPGFSLSPIITTGGPVLVFFATAFFLRRFLGFVFRNPAQAMEKPAAPFSAAATIAKLLSALLPTSLLGLISAAVILHRGSVSELRHPEAPDATLLARWKQTITSLLPPSLSGFLDPSTSPERLSLARFIAARAKLPPTPEIDPETGKPIPRAIIVDDPELQGLARSGDFSTLLRHPLVGKLLDDPKVKSLIEGGAARMKDRR